MLFGVAAVLEGVQLVGEIEVAPGVDVLVGLQAAAVLEPHLAHPHEPAEQQRVVVGEPLQRAPPGLTLRVG